MAEGEALFQVSEALAGLIRVTKEMVKATYADSGIDHAPPTFLGIGREGLGAIYFEGEGEDIDTWREDVFSTQLGTGSDQYMGLCFICEAWTMVRPDDGSTPDSIHEHPNREEAIIYEARDTKGNVAKGRQLITRGEDGMPVFGEFKFLMPGRATYLPSVSEER